MNDVIAPQEVTFADLLTNARLLAEAQPNLPGPRAILGITGPPGAGKSTLAQALWHHLPGLAVLVSMDGFHLANSVLDAAGSRGRKGAPDTFDVAGFVNLLDRLHRPLDDIVYAPEFDRTLEESIASSIPVPRHTPLVIVEGNYLLHDGPGWDRVAGHLSESWFLAPPHGQRFQQLMARHESFGRTPEEAAHWTLGSDQANAELVERSRGRATRVIHVPSLPGVVADHQRSTS